MILHSVCSGIAFRYSGMAIPFFRKLHINHQDTFEEIRNDIYFDYSNYAKKYFDTRKEAS